MLKKLPPYGKPLNDLLKDGLRPLNSINLFIGNKAWDKGKKFSLMYPERTLILPPWISPDIYFWPVNQCDVLVFDSGYADSQYLDDLIYSLYEDGADIIRSICADFTLTTYEKDF